MRSQSVQRRAGGLLFFLIGAAGSIVLLVVTATGGGAGAYGTFYAPPAFVLVVLVLFLIIFMEAGGSILLGSDSWGAAGSVIRSPLVVWASWLLFAIPLLGLAGAGVFWAVQQLAGGGLVPSRETYVVGGLFLVYGAIRIPIALRWVNGAKLAHAVGIRRGGPDPGESAASYATRSIIGFAVGVLVLDALIVLVNAVVAPGDPTFLPGASATTPLAALLWIVGLMGIGSIVIESIRTKALYRSLRAALVSAALIPALVIDARIPLYPVIAGIAAGNWAVSVNGVPVGATSRATPFVTRSPFATPTPRPTPTPDAKVSGLVRWGELAVPFVNVGILNNGVVQFALTDSNGRFEAPVLHGTMSADVDVGAISLATWFTASRPGLVQIGAGADLTYPTIYLTRRINLTDPVSGASVAGPTTFRWTPQWQSLDAAVTYELRVMDDGPAGVSSPGQSTDVFSRRTTDRSMSVTTLPSGRKYRWEVNAYITPRGGVEMVIGRATMSSFTTR